MIITLKELVEEPERQITRLIENTGKYITLSVPIKKEVIRINNKRKQITQTISYRLQFIDSARFKAMSVSYLVNNPPEVTIELNVNTELMMKNVKITEFHTAVTNAFLNTQTLKII